MKLLSLLIILLIAISSELFAQDYYFTDTQIGCTIQAFVNNQLVIVSPEKFLNRPLKIQPLKNNPAMMAFTVEEQVYIAPKNCLTIRVQTAVHKVVWTDQYYLEFETGIIHVYDYGQVPVDYNAIFPPADVNNPTKWGEAEHTKYNTNYLFHLGFGIKATPESYYAFKIRMFKGSKLDTVTLTAINTGITQQGNWRYNDLFATAYFGYKAYFPFRKTKWEILLAGYLGFSTYRSTLSDGTNTFNLTSTVFPVYMIETGPEYRIEKQIGLSFNIGYEFLGKRLIKPEGATNFRTKMSYSNLYSTLGVKYYY